MQIRFSEQRSMLGNLLRFLRILKNRGLLATVKALYNYIKRNPYILNIRYQLSLQRIVNLLLRSKYKIIRSKDIHYANHIWRTEPTLAELMQQERDAKNRADAPRICIVTHLKSPSFVKQLAQTAKSVMNQTYMHWVWLIVDETDQSTGIPGDDPRIRVIFASEGIVTLNQALAENNCEFIAFLRAGDYLPHHALYTIVHFISQENYVDLVYTDSDCLQNRSRSTPFFKPNWSPELVLSINICTELLVIRRQIIQEVNFLDPRFKDAYEWNLVLKASEITDAIFHIPEILYHRSEKRLVEQVSKQEQEIVLKEHLTRCGLQNSEVIFDDNLPIHTQFPLLRWRLDKKPLISIIIPTRDQPRVLEACLESIFTLTQDANFEVIIVDTGSEQAETKSLYSRYWQRKNFRIVNYTGTFNFSAACNLGYKNAKGDLILFQNNDTAVLQTDWLQLMAQWFANDEIGIVGPKLLYPNGTIQHAGVIVGIGGIADHIFSGFPENIMTVFGSDNWYRNFLAVTGACLMISKTVFKQVGGFDESFILNFSDIDLCLKVIQAGYRIVYTPHVRLIHYEATTHRKTIPLNDFVQASTRFKTWLESGDPYFNRNLAYAKSLQYSLKKQNYPIEINRRLITRLPTNKTLISADDVL